MMNTDIYSLVFMYLEGKCGNLKAAVFCKIIDLLSNSLNCNLLQRNLKSEF
jgi:hypothetical protein